MYFKICFGISIVIVLFVLMWVIIPIIRRKRWSNIKIGLIGCCAVILIPLLTIFLDTYTVEWFPFDFTTPQSAYYFYNREEYDTILYGKESAYALTTTQENGPSMLLIKKKNKWRMTSDNLHQMRLTALYSDLMFFQVSSSRIEDSYIMVVDPDWKLISAQTITLNNAAPLTKFQYPTQGLNPSYEYFFCVSKQDEEVIMKIDNKEVFRFKISE
jgi:hypothetical protein